MFWVALPYLLLMQLSRQRAMHFAERRIRKMDANGNSSEGGHSVMFIMDKQTYNTSDATYVNTHV